MLKDDFPAAAGHSDPDPERSEGEREESRHEKKGLARFLVCFGSPE
jgi:hypothetical protein